MSKNKNLVIGGLLAIVLVMAVGYAAFSTQLTINGTANVTSNWDVHFDTTKTTGTGVIDTTIGLTGAAAPTGTISYTGTTTANLTANLNQPGDKVKFTLTVLNAGDLKAKAGNLTLTGGTVSGLTSTSGNIKFTVTNPSPTSIAGGSSATVTVIAEFTDVAANTVVKEQTASLTVTIPYTQDKTA